MLQIVYSASRRRDLEYYSGLPALAADRYVGLTLSALVATETVLVTYWKTVVVF